jgi:hypothetical protein
MKTKQVTWLCFSIALLFTACVTEKQRAKICNTCSVTSGSKDSTSERLRDTTIYITTPGPIQYLPNPCALLCDSAGKLKPFEKTEIKKGIKSTIKSQGNTLVVSCEADSLKQVIKDLKETIHYHQVKESSVKYVPCDKAHKTKFDGFTFWWFWITLSIIVVGYLIKVVKTYRLNG